MIELFNCDCMELMAKYPDKHFDLAIVDPPYGINAPNMSMGSNPNRNGIGKGGISTAEKLKGRLNSGGGALKDRFLNNSPIGWDNETPTPEYWKELFRVSKNQIIWGGNYFPLPPTRGIAVWNKNQPWDSFSQCELAWTSFDCPARLKTFNNRGGKEGEIRVHPTQKPVEIYKWLIDSYAVVGDKILDTHLGSGSSAIAAQQMNFDFIGCEIDKSYFDGMKRRFNIVTSQTNMFHAEH